MWSSGSRHWSPSHVRRLSRGWVDRAAKENVQKIPVAATNDNLAAAPLDSPAMPQPTFHLTDEQIEFFHREGYLAIDQITTPADVAALRDSYDRIFAQRAGREEGNQFDLAGTNTRNSSSSRRTRVLCARNAVLSSSPWARESLARSWSTVSANASQEVFAGDLSA